MNQTRLLKIKYLDIQQTGQALTYKIGNFAQVMAIS